MRCLVTGGAGFIGSNLAIHLEKEGHKVIIADNFSSGHKDNIKCFKGKVLNLDISNPFDIKDKLDVIFHQAAITDPRYDKDDIMMRQNLDGFKSIIKLAEKNSAKLIYASTASLYGNGPSPQKESQTPDILSAYAKSKLMMDRLAETYFDRMHIVGLRYFNVFGPGESYKGRTASMIYHLIKQIRQGKMPKIFKWGEQKRDHIYVKDCVAANIMALDAPSGIYNIGTGIATSFNELIKLLNHALKTNLEPEYFDMPFDTKSYQSHTQADTTKAEKMLKFKAKYPLKKAIEEYTKMIP